jgi:hypothetical protein
VPDPLGVDLATLPDGDLDPLFGLLDGPALVARDLQAELLTLEDALWYAPGYGLGLAGEVAKRVTDASRATLAARVEEVCMRDDRVGSVTAEVTGELDVAVEGVTATGAAFRFVVDAASAAARLAETP